MDHALETDLVAFLAHLSAVQAQTLDVLVRKQGLLAKADWAGLAALEPEEQQLVERLQGCLERRESLLKRAEQQGHTADSIRSLAKAVSTPRRKQIAEQVRQAAHHARLLQHHSLVNWVLIQKTLLHLSQLLEIIATGGRLQPTYQKDGPALSPGSLIDRAA